MQVQNTRESNTSVRGLDLSSFLLIPCTSSPRFQAFTADQALSATDNTIPVVAETGLSFLSTRAILSTKGFMPSPLLTNTMDASFPGTPIAGCMYTLDQI